MACKLKINGKEINKQTLANILQQLGNNQDFRNALIYDNYLRLTSEEANVTTDAKDFLKDIFNLNSIDDVNDAIRTEQVRRDTQGVGKERNRWSAVIQQGKDAFVKNKRKVANLFSNKGPFAQFGSFYGDKLNKARIRRDGEINAWITKASRYINAFQSEIDKLDKYLTESDKIAFSNILKNKNGLADKNWESIPFPKLEGNPRADEIKNNIRQKLEPIIKNMRDHIDEGTKFITSIPNLTNKVQADIFLNNLGKYTTVLYEVHRNEDWISGFDTDDSGKILDPDKREVFQAAIPHVKAYLKYEEKLLNRLRNKKVKSINTISSSAAPLTNQQSAVLEKLRKEVKFIDNRLNEISGALGDRDLLYQEVMNTLKGMYKGDNITNMTAGGYRGAMAKGIFKQRKNIPQEVRNLFGEIKDPADIYMYTITKMAALASNAEFQTKMYDINKVMLDAYRKDPNKAFPPLFSITPMASAGLTEKISLSDSYSVLTSLLGANEVYVTEETKDFFKSEIENPSTAAIFQALHTINAGAKISATVLNAPTQEKNFLANLTKVASVILVSRHRGEVLKQLGETLYQRGRNEASRLLGIRKGGIPYSTEQERLEYVMVQQGIKNSDVSLADIKKELEATPWIAKVFGKDGFLYDVGVGKVKPLKPIVTGIQNTKDAAFRLYAASDDIAKELLFIAELNDYSYAYFGKTYKELLKTGTPEQIRKIEDIAGVNVSSTIPNYNQAWNLVKVMQKSGYSSFFAPFAIFRLEQARTFYETAVLSKNELKNNHPDPEVKKRIRAIGRQRLIGFLVLIAASSNTILNFILSNLDDEEEEYLKKWGYIPDYMESPILSKKGNNTFEVMDASTVNIYGSAGMIDQMMYDVVKGQVPLWESFVNTLVKLAGPIVTPQIGAMTLANLLFNKNQWGQELWTDADKFTDVLNKASKAFIDPLIPGTYRSYNRIAEKEAQTKDYLDDLKRLSNDGQEQSLIEFQKEAYILSKKKIENEKIAFVPGVRFTTMRPESQLPTKVYEAKAGAADAKVKFKNDIGSIKGRAATNKELIDKYKEVRKIYWDNLSKIREYYIDSKAMGFDIDRVISYGPAKAGINKIEDDKKIFSNKELDYIMGKTNIKPDLVIEDFDKEIGIERNNKTGECLNCQEAFIEALRKDKSK